MKQQETESKQEKAAAKGNKAKKNNEGMDFDYIKPTKEEIYKKPAAKRGGGAKKEEKSIYEDLESIMM